MEESTSWKGHSFTLLVFGGIVFLCSIFFVLGMLVGRGQGQRAAETASAATAARVAAAKAGNEIEVEKTELTTYKEPVTSKAPAPAPAAGLPTPEDYEQQAIDQINPQNMDSELDKLEKDIGQ